VTLLIIDPQLSAIIYAALALLEKIKKFEIFIAIYVGYLSPKLTL